MRGALVAVIGVAFAAGCGSAVSEIVRDGIDEGTKRPNWEKLRVPLHDLSKEIAGAVLEAAPPAELAAQLDAIVDRAVRATMHALSEELDGEASPALARAVRASIDAALASLLSTGTVHRVEEITDALITAVMAGLARGIRQQIAPALEHSLGPAMQHAIQNNLGPAMAATLDHDFAPVLVKISRQTSEAAAEGLGEGLRNSTEPMIDRAIVRVQAALDRAEQDAHSILAPVAVAILAALAGVLAVVLWLRHRAALAGRDAVQMMASEIARLSSEPAVLELARRIKVSGEGRTGGALLSNLLRSHPSIKVHPPSQPALIGEAEAH